MKIQNQPMWTSDPIGFSRKYKITLKQTKQLQCTGEHLVAHANGGPASIENIVAACAYCNRRRHQRDNEISPGKYKSLIAKRLHKGRWHGIHL